MQRGNGRSWPVAILLLHAIVFVALAAWSWRKWPDPLIDFGRELYVPWQITRGRVLYRDIASLFGPLSPYVNALWFRMFGASLMTLALSNMVIFAAIVAGIYRFIRVATDRVTAAAAGLSTLLLFGFCQYLDVGNYNFVCPYSHEATHGIALSVGLLLCLQQAVASGRRIFWAGAGVCFGLVLLTKPETSLAAGAGVAVAWIGTAALDTHDRRALRWSVPIFMMLGVLPPLMFFLFFLRHMSAGDAVRAVSAAWTATVGTGIASNEFYLRGLGWDRPWPNSVRMLVVFAGYLIFVAMGVAVSRTRGTSQPSMIRRIEQLAFLLVAVVFALTGRFPYALPLITLAGLGLVVVLALRAKPEPDQMRRWLSLGMWSAFSLVLLAKMSLNARIVHYGFYLALPATIFAIVQICWLIPHLMNASGTAGGGRTFRQIAVCMLVAAMVPYLALSQARYRDKVLSIGSGSDRFFASASPGLWQGAAVRDAQLQLERSSPPTSTLAVIPEGVMLNYLLRRDSPLRVVNLMPPEVLAFGEEEILRSLEAAPPDFLLLTHRDVREYGYPPFGTDRRYGLRTMDWVRAHYRTVEVIGHDPMSSTGFGVQILQRTF
jgi:hypothetical protein